MPAGVTGRILENNIPSQESFTLNVKEIPIANGLDLSSPTSMDEIKIAGIPILKDLKTIKSMHEEGHTSDKPSISNYAWITGGTLYIRYNGAKLYISSVDATDAAKKHGNISSTFDYRYTITIEPSSEGLTEEMWDLKYELRHMPENATDCSKSISNDLVSHLGQRQEKSFQIMVKPEGQGSSLGFSNLEVFKNTNTRFDSSKLRARARLSGPDISNPKVFFQTKDKDNKNITLLEWSMSSVDTIKPIYEADFVGPANGATLGTTTQDIWAYEDKKLAATDAEIWLHTGPDDQNGHNKYTGKTVTIQCGPDKQNNYGTCTKEVCSNAANEITTPLFATNSLKCLEGYKCCKP